jgi:hypothetical protein
MGFELAFSGSKQPTCHSPVIPKCSGMAKPSHNSRVFLLSIIYLGRELNMFRAAIVGV